MRNKRWIILSILLFFCCCMAVMNAYAETLQEKDYPGKTVEESIIKGAHIYNDGDLDGALSEFKKAMFADTKSTEAAYFLGMAYEKKNDPKEAFIAYSRPLKTQPQGYVVSEFGNYAYSVDEKVKKLLKDNKLKEQLVSEYVKQVPWGQSKLEGANKLFKEGWVLHRDLGLYDESIKTYLRAIVVDPQFADAYKEIGLVYMKKGDYATAKVFLERALKIQPNNSMAFHDLGICKGELGASAEEVKESYQKALIAAPDNIFPMYALGRGNILDGHYEEGIALLEKAISQNPEYQNSYEPLLMAYLKTGQYDKAIDTAQKALVLFPEDMDIRMVLAKGYKNKKMYDKAIAEYNKILGSGAHSFNCYIGLAGVYVAQGETGKAVMMLEENLSASFNDKKACASYGLGKIYMEDGKYEDAARELEAVLKADPNRLDIIEDLQLIYAQYLNNAERTDYFEKEHKRLTAKYEEEKPWLIVNKGGISGFVTKIDGKTPIAGIKVDVFGDREAGDVLTDLDGRFAIGHLPEGAYKMQVNLFGYDRFSSARRDNVAVAKDVMIENIDFKLKGLGSISGKVSSNDGKPVVGVSISATNLETMTEVLNKGHIDNTEDILNQNGMAESDENGNYRMTNLLPGNYMIMVIDDSYSSEEYSRAAVKEAEETQNVNITVHPFNLKEEMRKLLQDKQ